MYRRNQITVLMALIIALVFAGIPTVWAQDPTIPTRTPTPDPNQPDPEPSPTSDDPGESPPPEATEPSDPDPDPGPGPGASPTSGSPGSGPGSPTATTASSAPGAGPGGASTAVPGSGTPAAGQRPGTGVIGACDETPYVKAIAVLNVHAGPGDDYPVVAELGAEDMRPIIGRGYYAQWWQIQFDETTIGWVADAEVDEYGNTALVPLVVAPPINGNIPTPGAIWNPTPLPLLTCVPTPTPTSTSTPSPTPTSAGATGASTAGGGGVTGSTGGGDSQTQNDPQVTPTVGMVSAEVGDSAPVAPEEAASSGLGVSSRNSEASRAASPTSTVNLILPLAGLALISGGIILALVSRKQGGANTDTTASKD